MQDLADLSERQIQYVFDKAAKECKFIPKVSELREWAAEASITFQQQDADNRSRQLFTRGDKPDNWNPRMESLWAELDSRAEAQERLDLAYFEPFTDEEIITAMKLGKPYPGKDLYTDWLRRKEARERRASGAPRPSMQARYRKMFETIAMAPREPGEEG